jgi:hypothetical protein
VRDVRRSPVAAELCDEQETAPALVVGAGPTGYRERGTAILVLDLDPEDSVRDPHLTDDPVTRGVGERVGDEFGGDDDSVVADDFADAPRDEQFVDGSAGKPD